MITVKCAVQSASTAPPYVMLDPQDTRWLAFAQAHPDATPFHHPGWLNLLEASYGYQPFVLAITAPDGAIRAGLPLMRVRSVLTGQRWISLPFSDYCMPLAQDTADLEQLTDVLVTLSADHTAPRIDLRWHFPDRPSLHMYKHFYLHKIPLECNQQQVGLRFDSAHRQNIRAAKKKGVRIERGTDEAHLKAFFSLQLSTRQRKGLPVQPWQYFRLLKPYMFDHESGFVMLAYQGDDLLAGAVFLNWGSALMAKYAASYEETLNLRPNNLIFWEAICWGCNNGYQIFDMGRTALQNEGLREFKLKWGAEETPLYYTTTGKPRGPHEGRTMHIMNYVIQRAPLWVCRRAGEILYRHFG